MIGRALPSLAAALSAALGVSCATESRDSSERSQAGRGGIGEGGRSGIAGSVANGDVPLGGSAGNAEDGGGTSLAGRGSQGGSSGSGAGGGTVGGGSAGTSAGGAAGAGACPVAPSADGSQPMIDDLDHVGSSLPSNEGRSGVWSAWTLNPSAVMTPPLGMFETIGAEAGGDGYVQWIGSEIGGPGDWGPTLTVQLSDGCPYDASVYSGISFRLRGTFTKEGGGGSSVGQLKLIVWQPEAVPASAAEGGTCVASSCFNNYRTYVTVPADWTASVAVPFTSLVQDNWAGTVPFAWNPSEILAIQFHAEVNGDTGELATFELSLDDLSFVP